MGKLFWDLKILGLIIMVTVLTSSLAIDIPRADAGWRIDKSEKKIDETFTCKGVAEPLDGVYVQYERSPQRSIPNNWPHPKGPDCGGPPSKPYPRPCPCNPRPNPIRRW
jgi:hypothetical protein